MVLEINETVFGTETCKSGEAAGEQTDPKVDMQIANHPCRILPLLYYCCDRQHCVQGVSYQTGICNLGWCVGMGCIVTTTLAHPAGRVRQAGATNVLLCAELK